MSWKPRVDAKKKCKVDKALYQCQLCSVMVYEGKSPTTFIYYSEVYPNVIMDNFFMDHILPVVAVDSLSHSWDIYFARLFCPEENFQGICKPCHDLKTKSENKERKSFKGKTK